MRHLDKTSLYKTFLAAAPSGEVEDALVVACSGVPELPSGAIDSVEACSARADSGEIPGRTWGGGGPAGAAARPLPRPRAPDAGGGGRGGLEG